MLLAWSLFAFATPVQIPVAGLISAADGDPSGAHTLTLRLYADSADTTADITEEITTELRDGVFAVRLGEGGALDHAWFVSHPNPELTIALDGGAPSARVSVGTAPLAAFAHAAATVPAAGIQGVVPDANLPADLARTSGATFTGPIVAASFSGGAGGLTGVPANQLSGVVPNANLPSDLARTTGAAFTGPVTVGTPTASGEAVPKGFLDTALAGYLPLTGGTLTGALTATSFTGSGAGLTNLPAGQLTGTIADARLAANVARTTGAAFTGGITGTTGAFTGTVSGNTGSFSGSVIAGDDLAVTDDATFGDAVSITGTTTVAREFIHNGQYHYAINGSTQNGYWEVVLDSANGEFGNGLLDITMAFSHCGGGCHWSYRRVAVFLNAYCVSQVVSDVENNASGNSGGSWTWDRVTTYTDVNGAHCGRLRIRKAAATGNTFGGPVNITIRSNTRMNLVSSSG